MVKGQVSQTKRATYTTNKLIDSTTGTEGYISKSTSLMPSLIYKLRCVRFRYLPVNFVDSFGRKASRNPISNFFFYIRIGTRQHT